MTSELDATVELQIFQTYGMINHRFGREATIGTLKDDKVKVQPVLLLCRGHVEPPGSEFAAVMSCMGSYFHKMQIGQKCGSALFCGAALTPQQAQIEATIKIRRGRSELGSLLDENHRPRVEDMYIRQSPLMESLPAEAMKFDPVRVEAFMGSEEIGGVQTSRVR